MEKFLSNKCEGITLVALVITIIILLILAGVAISQLSGNGIFEQVKLAKEKSENSKQLENNTLADYESEINNYIEGNRASFNESQLLLTVTETSWTKFEIPNLDSYKLFIAYIHYPANNEIIQDITFMPEQLKESSETSSFIQPFFKDTTGTHCGWICYGGENKIKAYVRSCKMDIYGIK